MKLYDIEKRSLKENLCMIMTGYKIVFQVYHRYIFWNVIGSIMQSISPYFSLYMSTLVINELSLTRDTERLFLLAVITVCGLFLFNVINRLINGRINVYGSDTWRLDLLYYLKKQNRMQYKYLENADVSLLRETIYSAKTSTGAGIQMLLWNIETFVKAISNVVCSVVLTVSLFTPGKIENTEGFWGLLNSPAAVLILVTVIGVNTVVSVVTTNRETRKVEAEWQELAVTNRKYRALNLWGHDTFIYNIHKMILREMQKMNDPQYVLRAQRHKLKYGMIRTLWNYVMTLILFLFVAAKAYIGAFGIGNFVLYQGTVSRFIEGISDIAYVFGRVYQNNEALANLLKFLDIPEEKEVGALSIGKEEKSGLEIEFCNVSFKYPGSENWALRNVSAKLSSGSKIAIVGMNGSGKTTFIKLLCRLYEPTEGQILLNGVDIAQYKYGEYLSLLSVVFQDYKLFSFNIAENVAANDSYDREKVLACVKMAGLERKIRELEKGIETPLHRDYENGGIEMSGGESQKLAIARALYKESPFIVLDEPTAKLDPLAEAEVYSRFDEIIGEKTAIYISHRLSSCRFCNHIIVFHEGRIVQQGNHMQLVADSAGKYYELWTAQAQYYDCKSLQMHLS